MTEIRIDPMPAEKIVLEPDEVVHHSDDGAISIVIKGSPDSVLEEKIRQQLQKVKNQGSVLVLELPKLRSNQNDE